MEHPDYNHLRECKKIVVNKLIGLDFNSVLEFGSQWGEVLVAIKEKFPEVKLVGIDIDKVTTDNAKSVTNLDLRLGDAFSNNFHDKEFDVVVSDAFCCMIRPEEVEQALKEMIRIAKKYIVLVELKTSELTGFTKGGRTGANWTSLFFKYKLNATEEKITPEMWEVNPWLDYGYIYLINLDETKPLEVNQETGTITQEETIQVKKPFCDTCASKGVRHLKTCPNKKW